MPRPLSLASALVLNLFIVGGTYIWGKYSLKFIPPFTLGLIRFALAALLLHVATRYFMPTMKIEKSDRGRFFLLAILVIPLNQVLFLVGLNLTTPAHSALMYSTLPIFIYLISLSYKEESFAWLKSIGILMAFLGVFLILNEKALHLDSDYVIGDLIILIAVVAWAFYTIIGLPLVRKYGAIFVTARALGWGTIMFIPLGIYFSIDFDFTKPPLLAYLGVVYMATMTSIVAYVIWYWVLKYMDASKVGVINNFQPVVTAMMSLVLFGEAFTLAFIVGGAIIFAGVSLTLRG